MATRTLFLATVCGFIAASVADAQQLIRVTYPVSDIVSGEEHLKTLVNTLTKTIAPASWQERGGPGDWQFFPLGKALVINQTQEIHEAIQIMLARLRQGEEEADMIVLGR